MRKSQSASQLDRMPLKRYWRQGSLIDEQLRERNKKTGNKTLEKLRGELSA